MTTGIGDFDFLIGTWEVSSRRLAKPLTGSTEWDTHPAVAICRDRLFEGAANFDEITFPTKGFRGLTLRLYDPERGEWSLYWANSRTGKLTPPVVGRFSDDGTGEFAGDDLHDDIPIRCRFRWSRITGTTARWEQAFSADGEQTWETNWIMDFTRLAG
jgi:hypothetical protein